MKNKRLAKGPKNSITPTKAAIVLQSWPKFPSKCNVCVRINNEMALSQPIAAETPDKIDTSKVLLSVWSINC